MPHFKNKDGSLTEYSFTCGYIQTQTKDNVRTQLYFEGACYHVRAFCEDTGKRLYWDSYRLLTNARSVYNRGVCLINED